MIKSIIQIIKSYWEMDVVPFFRIMLKSNTNEAKHVEELPSNLHYESGAELNDFKTNPTYEVEDKKWSGASNADEMVQLSEMPYIPNTNKEKLN